MNGIVSKRSAMKAILALAVAASLGGCDGSRTSAVIPSNKAGMSAVDPWVDAERGRRWSLTREGVDLYDMETGRLLAQVELPDWLWAKEEFSCPPALALGPKGEALISSNVVSTIWRVDAVSFVASKHDLVLDKDAGKDVGFTGLTYSAEQGAFFAVSAPEGSLWRIDPLLRRAQNIPLSARLPNACGIALLPRAAAQKASRTVGLCVQADAQAWVVALAPDQRSGYIREGLCKS